MCENFIKVQNLETCEPIEIPVEKDCTVFLSSIRAQFPQACGLKYKIPSSGTMRGLKLVDNILYLPSNNKDWKQFVYSVVLCKENYITQKVESCSSNKCRDLIVLGLPWKIDEEELKLYFSQFGELTVAIIKRDGKGRSRGFGFIRYATYACQVKILQQTHTIAGRKCEVKIPYSQGEPPNSSKVFVGQINDKTTKAELQNYFSKFGEVIDVYISSPFRSFAFITFLDAKVAQSLIGQDHFVNGTPVFIRPANPKSRNNELAFSAMAAACTSALLMFHGNSSSNLATSGRGDGGSNVINRSFQTSASY